MLPLLLAVGRDVEDVGDSVADDLVEKANGVHSFLVELRRLKVVLLRGAISFLQLSNIHGQTHNLNAFSACSHLPDLLPASSLKLVFTVALLIGRGFHH